MDKKPDYLSTGHWGDYAELMVASTLVLRGYSVCRSLTSTGPIDLVATNLTTGEVRLIDVKAVQFPNGVPRVVFKESEAQKKFPGNIEYLTYWDNRVWSGDELVAEYPAEAKLTAKEARKQKRLNAILDGLHQIGPAGVPSKADDIAQLAGLSRYCLKIFGSLADLLKLLEETGKVALIQRGNSKARTLIHREYR